MARNVFAPENRALSPRAALRRTFGGMAIFIAAPLLGFGAYLIKDQFENPVGSHPAGLLVAALLIATALVLLSYVVHPGKTHQRKGKLARVEEAECRGRTIEISPGAPLALRSAPSDVPLQDHYVDAARNAGVAAQARGMAGK